MIKVLGMLLIVFSGAAAGAAVGGEYRRRYQSLCAAADMIEQMQIMLEFESPTVSQMIEGVRKGSERAPLFILGLPDNADAARVCASLDENKDGFAECDLHKLKELFSRLGSADKICEQQRLASAMCYFESRRQAERAETEKREKLAGSLGILGGIFAAVLML